MSDGTASTVGTVSITVSATLNQPPVGAADSYTVTEDATLTVNAPGVLGNDTDPDGQALTVGAGTATAHGTFTLNSDGSFAYTPGPNFNGTDSFTYQATDGAATTAPVTVTITVTAVNDAPTAANDTIPIAKDSFVAFSLANRSTDVDGDTLTGTLIDTTQHGTLFFDGTQLAFSYKPVTGFVGQDFFTYKVNDGTVDSAVATVTLVVT
ncbi:tandem-95 repeat protein [Mycolicibacterium sp. P1-18]|nr:tandem-95 repeat protein [Mycolicibacterium sp. P1-18]